MGREEKMWKQGMMQSQWTSRESEEGEKRVG